MVSCSWPAKAPTVPRVLLGLVRFPDWFRVRLRKLCYLRNSSWAVGWLDHPSFQGNLTFTHLNDLLVQIQCFGQSYTESFEILGCSYLHSVGFLILFKFLSLSRNITWWQGLFSSLFEANPKEIQVFPSPPSSVWLFTPHHSHYSH